MGTDFVNNSKYNKISQNFFRFLRAQFQKDGQTGRRDDVNSRFSQLFREHA